ncbi:MAG: hypothetical protein DRI57_32325 [Deltaproteobacteria bacterium]|nr:MAG: hypothetical protein DRI57_32325 [Deltaproteobacteria bacterium]
MPRVRTYSGSLRYRLIIHCSLFIKKAVPRLLAQADRKKYLTASVRQVILLAEIYGSNTFSCSIIEDDLVLFFMN